ncbi:MAG: hypothetical protein HYX48_08315 [Chlamydiales bacterium]|nr:hypothetical protein [Chlamydiales bacterium]
MTSILTEKMLGTGLEPAPPCGEEILSLQCLPFHYLSRFACYLIAQNGDPRKPEIAQAQHYFAICSQQVVSQDSLVCFLEIFLKRLEVKFTVHVLGMDCEPLSTI